MRTILVPALIGLVLAFRSSSNLAVAYGISVSATMLIDTLLLALVARRHAELQRAIDYPRAASKSSATGWRAASPTSRAASSNRWPRPAPTIRC